MSQTRKVVQRVRALAADWSAEAQKRRTEADEEADKVWAARQYGLADSYEEAAQQAAQMANGWDETGSADFAWPRLITVWERLAEEAAKLAQTTDNRITVSYRQANAEGYQRAATALRAAVEDVLGK
jgi:hypothetical protein